MTLEAAETVVDPVMEKRLIATVKNIDQQLTDLKFVNKDLEANHEKLKNLVIIAQEEERDLHKKLKALENLLLHLDKLEALLYEKL